MTRTWSLLLLLAACKGGDNKDPTPTDDTDVTTDDTDVACDAAIAPDVALEGDAFFYTAPVASWSAVAGCSPTARYEVALGTTSGGDELATWRDVGLATSADFTITSPLPEETTLYVSVRTVDEAGHTSAPDAASFTLWTPAALGNLDLWLDARHGLYSDDGCTVAAEDGDYVRCWMDRSGNAHHAKAEPQIAAAVVIPEATPAPVLDADGLAGSPALSMWGGRLQIDDTPALDAGAHLTVATMSTLDAPRFAYGAPINISYLVNKERTYEAAFWSKTPAAAVETVAEGNWNWGYSPFEVEYGPQLTVFQHRDTLWTLRSMGTELYDGAPANGQTGDIEDSDDLLMIGGRADGNVAWYQGTISEVIIVDAEVTTADRDRLERYLAERWGQKDVLGTLDFDTGI